MTDFKNRSNVALSGGITGNRDIITSSSLLRWVAEGKVFSAGVGVENTGIDSDSDTKNEQSPEAALVTSHSQGVYILPILVRMSVHTEGGALNIMHVVVTRAATDVAAGSTVITGTAMPSIQNHNSGLKNKPTAKPLYTAAIAGALANTDFIMLIKAIQADNPISGTGGLGFGGGTGQGTVHFELDMLEDPYLLSDGASLLIYPNTGTTDQKYMPYIVWAELTEDDLH